ncbi:cleavage and polyadenylation specificity factor subunit 7-like isoform X2 [Heterodontus francisci]|uniref:cleavage and polyadenylation specificity factor subunit 7-like isoform X2 n=1 Tax=Heterodontus francisci TaxID=7792 RepID=UPI00355C10DB
MGCFKMAVHSNMTALSVHELLDMDSEEDEGSEQPENENQRQMDLYDDLVNDIIGVPLNNGLNPKKDNCDLPQCSSNNIIVPTIDIPIKTASAKSCILDNIVAPLNEDRILFIGNLTWWTTGEDLVAAIRSAGIFNVVEIIFYEVRKGGQSKGFVRVNLSSDWDTNRLLKMLPNKEVHGRTPDVRHFTTENRQYFETQFLNAMEKSKLHLAQDDTFDEPYEDDSQFAYDPSIEAIEGDSTVEDETSSPFQQPPIIQPTSAFEAQLQYGCIPPFPFLLLHGLISLAHMNVPVPVLRGHGQSHTSRAACVDPMTFITPTNTSISVLNSNRIPAVYNTCYKDCRLPGREIGFPGTLQSKKEHLKGAASTNNDGSKDDSSEDYGTLLSLVSFVKKSKAVAKDSYRDSLNCPPNQLHGGEAKPYSSGLREHEYPRQRGNRRSGERSGSMRGRSRSPSSCDSHYKKERKDYDRERKQSHQRIHFENSPPRDHHSGRERGQRDHFDQERPCDSMRYSSRSSDSRHIYSEKRGKRQDYSPEKYCGIKRKKDREYQF